MVAEPEKRRVGWYTCCESAKSRSNKRRAVGRRLSSRSWVDDTADDPCATNTDSCAQYLPPPTASQREILKARNSKDSAMRRSDKLISMHLSCLPVAQWDDAKGPSGKEPLVLVARFRCWHACEQGFPQQRGRVVRSQ